ncbi:MAG TPA: DUF885 domain-containing protein [Pseudonocardiaceae bacterium]|jgi:uncharacterized protein (DUF885 family)|nr:DUF885 domain-containing protein [Pseudonocardiaceae bacterium]
MPTSRAIRDLADRHVAVLTELNPILATGLGVPGVDTMRDLSPDGQQAIDDEARKTLAELDGLDSGDLADDERRCARLLRERLTAELAVSEIGEHLRAVSNILGPVDSSRGVFSMMPTATDDDWAVMARRLANLPGSLAGYRASLQEGARRGLFAAPRQVTTMAGQLQDWRDASDGRGWFAGLADGADLPPALRADFDAAAAAAIGAADELRTWLLGDYLPRADGTPDAVGAERYAVLVRYRCGADLDLAEAYEWAWDQYRDLAVRQREQAERVLPGATLEEAVEYLDTHGEIVQGVDGIQARLQEIIDATLRDLDGTHFDLADPVKTVESRIAPAGSAAAPYYTRPSRDFSRPGRTWLPTLGRTSFPLWKLMSTWYHESVPGHHLQFGHWTTLAGALSNYQTGVGSVSAMTEGWALYAERLMDELGYLAEPGPQLGYLDAQIRRVIRVIIDIGMHLELPIPADSPVGAGQTWTPDLGLELFQLGSPRDDAFVRSEIVRYLGVPAQAIGYKLGERTWLAGRSAAEQAKGADFDLKSWHMAALSMGAVGLGDLAAELAVL